MYRAFSLNQTFARIWLCTFNNITAAFSVLGVIHWIVTKSHCLKTQPKPHLSKIFQGSVKDNQNGYLLHLVGCKTFLMGSEY